MREFFFFRPKTLHELIFLCRIFVLISSKTLPYAICPPTERPNHQNNVQFMTASHLFDVYQMEKKSAALQFNEECRASDASAVMNFTVQRLSYTLNGWRYMENSPEYVKMEWSPLWLVNRIHAHNVNCSNFGRAASYWMVPSFSNAYFSTEHCSLATCTPIDKTKRNETRNEKKKNVKK